MKTWAALLLGLAALPCWAQTFVSTQLSDENHSLLIHKSDHSQLQAPKLEDQDEFFMPAISRSGRYAGWLALYPNRSASYSQPLHLVVMDGNNRLQRFRGDFGMVFGWCFDPTGTAVVFMSEFPHGITPHAFEMRRLSDGRLMRQHTLAPLPSDTADEAAVLRRKTAGWARCALDNARQQTND